MRSIGEVAVKDMEQIENGMPVVAVAGTGYIF